MKKLFFLCFMASTLIVVISAKTPASIADYSLATYSNTTASSVTLATNSDSIADAIVTRSDVNLTIKNDDVYPWFVKDGYIENGNNGYTYSTSSVSFTYNCKNSTEVSFDWACYSWYSRSEGNTLSLIVDGAFLDNSSDYDYRNKRVILSPGTHIILLTDSIKENNYSYYDYGRVKNFQIKEIQPIESVILSSNSQPVSFSNNSEWPWTSEDGFVQNGNYNIPNSVSKFSTTFTINKPSKLSFERQVTPYNHYWDGNEYKSYQILTTEINGVAYYVNTSLNDWTSVYEYLPKGTYTIEWIDSIANTSSSYFSRIKNFELSSNWVNVDIASNPGTLGVEVLYQVNVLNDIELLKISGILNATDWATIKQMNNLIALDLSDAKFDAVPDHAFDGLSRLAHVDLPDQVKTIGEYAFKGTQIFDISIPNSVVSIEACAFANTRLKSITFGADSHLESLGYNVFYECNSLEEFIMPNSVTNLKTNSSGSIWDGERYDYCYYSRLFYNCTSLSKIHFSENLSTIPAYTCYNCVNLKNFNIPKNINRIEVGAFRGCAIEKLELPLTLSVLQYDAFSKCQNLKYIELPSYIGKYSSIFYGCNSLDTIVCRSATPPSILEDPFSLDRSKSEITLVVPSFAVVDYKLDPYWYQFGTIVEGDDIDYWKITGKLSLTNNRRMNGKPDIDLYDGGKLVVGGAAPMEVGQFNFYGNETNPACLLNDCPSMSADEVKTIFYFQSGKWYFFTPIHDIDLSQAYHTEDASYVFRYYDSSSRASDGIGGSWKNVSNGKLVAGQGYIFHCDKSGYIVMPSSKSDHNKMFATKDVTKQLSVYETSVTSNKNWNYVGNPYPCYYDIYYMDFTAPITVWNGSTYKAYSIADDDFVLRPMQAFFVQKPDAVDNIIFHKEGRQIESSINRPSYAPNRAPYAGLSRNFFNLQISKDDMTDETRVVINEDADISYEVEHDAAKFMSIDENVPQIYTIGTDGTNYAINERPLSEGLVKLGFYAGKSGFYTITAIRSDGDAILYDKVQNKSINLKEQDYIFHADASNSVNTNRFELKLSIENNELAINTSVVEKKISVEGSKGKISLQSDNAEVLIYTTSGNLLRRLFVEGNVNVPLEKGTYIVKTNNQTYKTVVF